MARLVARTPAHLRHPGWLENRAGAARPPRFPDHPATLHALRAVSVELPVLHVLPPRAARRRSRESIHGLPGGAVAPLPRSVGLRGGFQRVLRRRHANYLADNRA